MKIPRHYYKDDFSEFESYLLLKKHKLVKYKKGDRLFNEFEFNESPTVYYYIIKGRAFVYGLTEDGSKKLMCYYDKGTFTNPCLDNEQFSIYQSEFMEAANDVDILIFEKSTIIEILKDNFNFTLKIISFNNDLISLLSYQCLTLPYLKSETKLCDFIYMSYYYNSLPQYYNTHRINITQEEIANFIGITRTQVTRLLKILRKDLILQTYRGFIIILDVNSLLQRCSNVINYRS